MAGFAGFVAATVLLFSVVPFASADANGGYSCVACSIVVALGEQLAQVHSVDIVTALERFVCAGFPSPLDDACDLLLVRFGPSLIDGVYHKETADVICHNLGFCHQDPGKDFCHILPLPSDFDRAKLHRRKRALMSQNLVQFQHEKFTLCDLPGVQKVCDVINQFSKNHLPVYDRDGDKHSTIAPLRGSFWRGKDCDDHDAHIRPGRKPIDGDRYFDSNCNGIYGRDPESGVPFEDLYCAGTQHLGVVTLGDSAAAHFHIPPDYFRAQKIDQNTFGDLLLVLANEFDWPQLSFTTAFTENRWSHSIRGPVDSVYARLVERNRCIHRDYQNIGVNGAKSSSMVQIVKGLSRNFSSDFPVLLNLALIGNDVCNGHPDTVAHMTSPEDYKKNMITVLRYLDQHLPNGSYVALSGLADGRILWNLMHDRLHPIGELNSDVTYKSLYDYLNCLEVSPCRGWMNSNETIRNLTSQRAAELSKIGRQIAEENTFFNFRLIYYDYAINEILRRWEAEGGRGWEIIEPVDGFHPDQQAQAMTAEYFYQLFARNFPDALGAVNPFNDKIRTVFGNQNGY